MSRWKFADSMSVSPWFPYIFPCSGSRYNHKTITLSLLESYTATDIMSDNITYCTIIQLPLTPTVHWYTSLHRVYFCQNHSLPRVLCSIPTRISFIFQSFHPQETTIKNRGLCTTCRNSSEGKCCDVCAPPLMPKLNMSTTTLWDEMSKNPRLYI